MNERTQYPHPYARRRVAAHKLPPSGPRPQRRNEIHVPMVRRSIPSDATLEEMIELAPPFLQDQLRRDVPREIYAEAGGQMQLLQRSNHRAQTTFLEKSTRDDDE